MIRALAAILPPTFLAQGLVDFCTASLAFVLNKVITSRTHDDALMQLDNELDDVQPKPAVAFFHSAVIVELIEAVEDMGQFRWRNASAIIIASRRICS
ncbi:hypothetical protein [Methylomarinum vadi]|nr:hypothetical protein [Methylomarinum vadi]